MKRILNLNFFFFIFFCFSLSFHLAPFTIASDLSSASFIVRDPVVGVGSGYGSSGSFQLFQSLDPVLIGVGSSATFGNRYGFLYFPATTTSGSGDDTGGGGGTGSLDVYPYGCRIADFNCDGEVGILDLSILLYYADRPLLFVDGYDLSRDGVLDIEDISIMFYYWDRV